MAKQGLPVTPALIAAELLRDLVGIEMTEPGFTDVSRIRPERDDVGPPLRRIVLQRFAIIEHHPGVRDARNVTQRRRYNCTNKSHRMDFDSAQVGQAAAAFGSPATVSHEKSGTATTRLPRMSFLTVT